MTVGLETAEELQKLFAPVADQPAIGLAVSGGADSLALLLLAKSWVDSLTDAPQLYVYSVDHGLRPEARDEVAMVLSTAAQLGLSARGLAWTGDKPETGIQQAARTARYGLMAEAMAQDGATVLLTAHHRQDQAETLLMRMAHGSGIEGLKGMSAFAELEGLIVFRPLLGENPTMLREVVEQAGLVPVDDPSNTDTHYERVRWRQIMPALAELGLDGQAFSRFAQRMAEADAAIAQVADGCFAEIVKLDGFGAARIEFAPFAGLNTAISTRLLARVLNIVGGRQKPHALGQIEALEDLISTGMLSKTRTLLGCVVRADSEKITVAREPGRALPSDAIVPPHAELVWDERFVITNQSDDGALTASVADYQPRHRIEQILGFKVTAPAEAIRTAPIVRDAAGGVLSLGGWSFDERIRVQLLID